MSKRGLLMSRPVVIAGLCLLVGLFVVGFLANVLFSFWGAAL